MNQKYIIQTPRLGFRKWQESDLPLLCAMNKDALVMKYFPNILTEFESEQMFDRINVHFISYTFGFYAVDLLETHSFIGFIGLGHPRFEAYFTPCVEIGWRILPQFWNNGYATEGALACLDYAFSVLNIPEIYSFTSVLNLPSKNVMKKIGMKKLGTFEHPNLEERHSLRTHVIYKKTNPFQI